MLVSAQFESEMSGLSLEDKKDFLDSITVKEEDVGLKVGCG